MSKEAKKLILDACCGSKMFWFDKDQENTVFNDSRQEIHTLCDGRKLEIKPDTLMDFRDLGFEDGAFKLVVFDPPHLTAAGADSWLAKKYGVLGKNWKDDLQRGFNECWRVLEDYGILIFKWNEQQIKTRTVIDLFSQKPLFGHLTGRSGKTKWLCFMKIPG